MNLPQLKLGVDEVIAPERNSPEPESPSHASVSWDHVPNTAEDQPQDANSAKGSRLGSAADSGSRPLGQIPGVSDAKGSRRSASSHWSTPRPSLDPSTSSHPFAKERREVRFVNIDRPTGPGDDETRELESTMPAMTMVPFFAWGQENVPSGPLSGAVETMLVKILSYLDKSLTRDVMGKLYLRTPKVTMQDLLFRHEAFSELSSCDGPTTAPPKPAGDEYDGGTAEAPHDGTSANQKAEQGTRDGNGGEPVLGEPLASPRWTRIPVGRPKLSNLKDVGALPMDNDEKHDMVRFKLLDVSQDIVWAFTPKEGSPLMHSVCIRFWGAVDTMLRVGQDCALLVDFTNLRRQQMKWEECDRGVTEKREYFIRDFSSRSKLKDKATPHLAAGKKSWAECTDCRSHKIYSSATEALEHLHQHHFECNGKTARPYADRCFVWLSRDWKTGLPMMEPNPGVLSAVGSFIERLEQVNSSAKELHSLVASAWHHPSREAVSRPPLFQNLVNAFKQIMLLYIIQARYLSLLNRAASFQPSETRWRRVVERALGQLRRQENVATDRAHDMLADAKRDVILSGILREKWPASVSRRSGSSFLLSLLSAWDKTSQLDTPTQRQREDQTLSSSIMTTLPGLDFKLTGARKGESFWTFTSWKKSLARWTACSRAKKYSWRRSSRSRLPNLSG